MVKRGDKVPETPEGIKLLTLATGIRWFGWGLSEAFIPVFLLLFVDNFFKMGLLASVYDIFFFLALPFAGYFADHIKAKRMIMAGLIIYVFIGMGYFMAGLTSAVTFLIAARALNGISYSLDQVGRDTYIIRHTPKYEESRTFGRFDLFTNLFWIIAVLVGIFLYRYMPLHWLFFFVVPTSVIAFFLVFNIKEKEIKKEKRRFSIREIYSEFFGEIKRFRRGLKLLALMNFGFGIIASAIYFFAPAISYSRGENIVHAVLIVLAYAIPGLFGKHLGKVADKKKEKIFFAGTLALMALLLSLMLVTNFYVVLVTVFLASALFELFYLTSQGVMARITDRTHLGETDSSLNAIGSLGAVIGPIIFGLLIDRVNLSVAYLFMIFISLLLSILVYKRKDYLRMKVSRD